MFQESDSAMLPGRKAPMPLRDQVIRWMWKTVECEGANIHMGFELSSVLEQAGLVVEHVRAEAIIQGQDTHCPLAYIMRAMLPRITKHGVASKEEIDIDTLEQRLNAETPQSVASCVQVYFWCRPLSAAESASPSACVRQIDARRRPRGLGAAPPLPPSGGTMYRAIVGPRDCGVRPRSLDGRRVEEAEEATRWYYA
jgi:hypothetical protein